MPSLKLKNGGSVSTTEKDVDPALLTVKNRDGTSATVELADLKEIEAVVRLIEEPDGFKEE